MAKYNFYISYCRSDGSDYAYYIKESLKKKGYSIWLDDGLIRSGSWIEQISEAIRESDCFIALITDSFLRSNWTCRELEEAISFSLSRSKVIIPLICTDEQVPMRLSLMINTYQLFRVSCLSELEEAIEKIDSAYGYELRSTSLYERLAEYKGIRNADKVAATACELIDMACTKLEALHFCPYKEAHSILDEVYRLYKELENYNGGFDEESKKTAHIIIDVLKKVENLLNSDIVLLQIQDYMKYVYFICVANRILFSDREIRRECALILTNGDAVIACPLDWCIERQKPFSEAYNNILQDTKRFSEYEFSEADKEFILGTGAYIFKAGNKKPEADERPREERKKEELLSEKDEILVSIARFMQEGNKLFDVLQTKGIAGDFLACLLTSYERLKNYCEVVGAKNVAADCVDRIIEIRRAIDKAPDTKELDEKVENGIKSLLGFTIKGSGSYDVFISFKNEDSDLAEKIYDYTQQHLKVPFWSKKTLPQLSKSEYEDAIYDAIRKSKHFIVVLSDLEYLKANWIKREMSAFDRAITEGRKKDANFVFVVTDNVYDEIIATNKMCLDERYCGYQIIKMSQYSETLIDYIS